MVMRIFDVSVFASTMETVCPHFNTTKQGAKLMLTCILNQTLTLDHLVEIIVILTRSYMWWCGSVLRLPGSSMCR